MTDEPELDTDSIGNLPLDLLDYDNDAQESMELGAAILDSFFYED